MEDEEQVTSGDWGNGSMYKEDDVRYKGLLQRYVKGTSHIIFFLTVCLPQRVRLKTWWMLVQT